ncbi:MAG: hypothetical protein M1324_01795 [Patescibacteria group bacterium]|nr:hypothetical protein [Patescibacteria group bacterium]
MGSEQKRIKKVVVIGTLSQWRDSIMNLVEGLGEFEEITTTDFSKREEFYKKMDDYDFVNLVILTTCDTPGDMNIHEFFITVNNKWPDTYLIVIHCCGTALPRRELPQNAQRVTTGQNLEDIIRNMLGLDGQPKSTR